MQSPVGSWPTKGDLKQRVLCLIPQNFRTPSLPHRNPWQNPHQTIYTDPNQNKQTNKHLNEIWENKKTIRISRPPENLIKICDISYVRFQSLNEKTPISRSMKKGYAASKNHFCCCLVTKWSTSWLFCRHYYEKNYILTALNDLSLRLICFQQVSLICDLTTKLWRKRISSQKQKNKKKSKCAKVPKVISNLHVSIFCDISLRLTNCSIFLQKCLPTYIFLHFVCPNANQFEGPNTYKKESKLCVQI